MLLNVLVLYYGNLILLCQKNTDDVKQNILITHECIKDNSDFENILHILKVYKLKNKKYSKVKV
jgi:hypothetical protein